MNILSLTSESASEVLSEETVAVHTWGGKGVSLLKLLAAGCPVSPGFVIPISICAEYWQAGQVLSAEIQHAILSQIQRLELATGKSFGTGAGHFQLAVRSGAAVSMPGMLCSVLNCASTAEVLQAVCRVWDSWMTPQARSYRTTHQLQHLVGTAVVVQIMVPATVSGVLFTTDPVRRARSLFSWSDPDEEEMILEAIPGTGDRLVSGEVRAWRWRIPSTEEPRCEQTLPGPSPLSHGQIQELANWGRRIANAFQGPVDIEWGWSESGWTFFQSRLIPPVLTPQQQHWLATEQQRFAKLRDRGETLWIRHNLTDSVRCPTPLTWSVLQQFMSGSGGFGTLYRRLGFAPSRRLQMEGFLELWTGQIYASPARVPNLYCTDWPFGYDLRALIQQPELLEDSPRQLDLDRVGPWFLLRLPWLMWVILRARRKYQHAKRTASQEFHTQTWPAYRQFREAEERRDLSLLPEPQLIALFHQREEQVFQQWAPRLSWPGLIGAAAWGELRELLRQTSSSEQADRTGLQILAALPQWEHIPLRKEAFELAACEDEEQDGGQGSPELRESTSVDVLWEQLRTAGLPGRQSNQIRELLTHVWHLLPLRELCKFELVRGIDLLREVLKELGRRTGRGPDLYFLTREELGGSLTPAMIQQVKERRQRWDFFRTLPHPAVLGSPVVTSAPVESAAGVLQGTVVSPGSVTGRAWCWDQLAVEPPPPGVILVCETLTVSLAPWFSRLQGMIVDQAGLLSHGALLARQHGLPVIAFPLATQHIQTGDELQFDGISGAITVNSRNCP